MWVRRSAIRPVAPWARVDERAAAAVASIVAAEDHDEARGELDAAFQRLERDQPAVAAWVAESLGKPLDETALALGYFLAVGVWLGFERSYGDRVKLVELQELEATAELLELDEELRRRDPAEAVDSDEVVAMEQPHLMAFVNTHVEGILGLHAEEVDVDDVHAVFRMVLVLVLALSYAVRPPEGVRLPGAEALA